MSSSCGNNCDCADKTQCVKKETSYGIDMVETGKTAVDSYVVMEVWQLSKCGSSWTCVNCTCGGH